MTVFKYFLRMAKRNSGMMFLYFAIFMTVSICIQFVTKGGGMENFQEESLDLAVIDRDGGELARELTGYLGRRHHLVDIADDPDVIQEELFYRNVQYVVIIPRGFSGKLQTIKIPGANSAFYVDWQIDQFLSQIETLKAAGYEGRKLYGKAEKIEAVKSEVKLLDKNGRRGGAAPYAYMFQYMPYIIFSIICYVIGYIMIGFRKKDVRRRMDCAAMPPRRQNAQLVLGHLTLGAGVWAVCMLMPVLLYGKDFLSDSHMLLYMANAFAVTLVSLSISFAVSAVVRKEVIISGIVNVLSLGMSFVCGVFVSMDVLGKGVRAFAQFLPFYWYESVNQILSINGSLTAQQQWGIFKGMGIQALFAAAIVCVGMVLDRYVAE